MCMYKAIQAIKKVPEFYEPPKEPKPIKPVSPGRLAAQNARRKEMVRILKINKSDTMSAQQLANALNVSVMTIRTDVDGCDTIKRVGWGKFKWVGE